MQGRWPRCEAVCGKGQDLVNRGHESRLEIGSRIKNLMDKWKQLQDGAAIRRTRLEDSIEAQQVCVLWCVIYSVCVRVCVCGYVCVHMEVCICMCCILHCINFWQEHTFSSYTYTHMHTLTCMHSRTHFNQIQTGYHLFHVSTYIILWLIIKICQELDSAQLQLSDKK